jgi:60 kDa SS-A/Ro ribonucleoprotein
VVSLIRDHRFTHEMLRTEWKNDPEVWAALLADMPQDGHDRNLGKMTSVGVLGPMSDASKLVASALTDKDRLARARIHPIAVLSALKVYEQGHGERAKQRENALSWSPVREIVDALNEAFYLAFKSIEPTGKKHLLALDVSGSMASGSDRRYPGLTPRVASGGHGHGHRPGREGLRRGGFTAAPATVASGEGVSWHHRASRSAAKQRLDDVLRTTDRLPMGGTDCSLPMIWAARNKVPVDTFVIYTDNETWAGAVHPFQALREYRQKMGRLRQADRRRNDGDEASPSPIPPTPACSTSSGSTLHLRR